MTCPCASSGCNYPEAECAGVCMAETRGETVAPRQYPRHTPFFWPVVFVLGLILLGVSLAARADVTFLLGKVKFGPSDDGTYYNQIKHHDIQLYSNAWGLRYDSPRLWRNWSVGVQYTDLGMSLLDAQASSRDAPDPGGYDPATKSCIGGTCAPEHRYVARSAAKSIAVVLTTHIDNWSFGLGAHAYEIKTDVTVFGSCLTSGCGTSWAHSKTAQHMGAVLETTYRLDNSWSIWLQVMELEGKGPIPSIFVGNSVALFAGYTF